MNNSGMWRGALYGITAASIWGSMYVISDLVLLVVPPFTLLTLRILLGLAVLLPLSLRQGHRLPGGRSLRSLLGAGVVGLGLSLGAQFVGTDLSTAVNGALVTSASPAFVVFFAVLLLRERLTFQRLAAIVTASVGVLIILDPASADFASDTFAGDVFLAVAAVTWGLYSALVRRAALRHTAPTLMVTVVALFGGLVVSIPASVLELSQRPVGPVTLEIVLGILYLGHCLNRICAPALESRLQPGSRHNRVAVFLRAAAGRRATGGAVSGPANDGDLVDWRHLDCARGAAVANSRAESGGQVVRSVLASRAILSSRNRRTSAKKRAISARSFW